MTLDELKALLTQVDTKIQQQGRIVDDRLLEKKRQIEQAIAELEI